jgi:hypothetical protein
MVSQFHALHSCPDKSRVQAIMWLHVPAVLTRSLTQMRTDHRVQRWMMYIIATLLGEVITGRAVGVGLGNRNRGGIQCQCDRCGFIGRQNTWRRQNDNLTSA